MLSLDEIDRFVADGFVAVRGAIPPGVTRACQEIIWADPAPHGVRRDDPATWSKPVIRIVTPGGAPFAAAGTTRLVGEACDQLLGPGRWIRHPGVGPDDAPTRLRPGSHLDVPRILAPGGDDGMPWLPRPSKRRRPARTVPPPGPPAEPATSSSATPSWCTPRPGRTAAVRPR